MQNKYALMKALKEARAQIEKLQAELDKVTETQRLQGHLDELNATQPDIDYSKPLWEDTK